MIPPPPPPTGGDIGRGGLRRRMSLKSGALSPGGQMRPRARRPSINNTQPQVRQQIK